MQQRPRRPPPHFHSPSNRRLAVVGRVPRIAVPHAQRRGRALGTGTLGGHLTGIAFDAVSLHLDDSALMAARLPVAASLWG
jgi:hypothetical protein